MTQDEKERKFIADAVMAAERVRSIMIREVSAGGVIDFIQLRKLDMDIKQCKDELRRSAC